MRLRVLLMVLLLAVPGFYISRAADGGAAADLPCAYSHRW